MRILYIKLCSVFKDMLRNILVIKREYVKHLIVEPIEESKENPKRKVKR